MLCTKAGTQIVAEEMWNHLETEGQVSIFVSNVLDLNSLDGSMGAGGRLEAGGMERYSGSFLGVNPGELALVKLRLGVK